MKAKALLTAVLLAATNFAWAQGGLSLDTVEKHMQANNWVATDMAPAEIFTQGAIDNFQVVLPDRAQTVVVTNKFKQSYNEPS